MRTREVWVHAVDLDNGATFEQIPDDVLERLIQDITGNWQKRGEETPLPEGTLAEISAWATGRGARGVASRKQPGQPAPRWM